LVAWEYNPVESCWKDTGSVVGRAFCDADSEILSNSIGRIQQMRGKKTGNGQGRQRTISNPDKQA